MHSKAVFNIFSRIAHYNYLISFLDMKVTQIMKLVGSAWQELDKGENAKYHKPCEEDKTRYEEEKDAFLAGGGDADAITKKPRRSKK